jgi:hypothetical protein
MFSVTSAGNGTVIIGTPTTFALNTCLIYDDGVGGTGQVCSLGNYTFASVIVNNAAGLYFNATGVTLPSNQLKFQAWNTSVNGAIPITIQTGTVKPTYTLNVTSYSYTTPNITISTLLSNQTVTVDFNLLGSYPVKVYASTGTIAAAPTYAANVLTFTVTDSGAGASTITQIHGAGEAPYAYTENGLVPGVRDAVVYVAGTDVVMVTGVSTWVLSFHQSSFGGSSSGTTVTTTTGSQYRIDIVNAAKSTATSSNQTTTNIGLEFLSSNPLLVITIIVVAVAVLLYLNRRKRRNQY